MKKLHHYDLVVKWTGNTGKGTSDHRQYARSHTVSIPQKADILCSSDPSFRGDRTRHNPEELFLASISTCHMLWFLHLCSENGVIVTDYEDQATGTMQETEAGGGHFTEVILHPLVTVTDGSMCERADALHHRANELCFIANSCNFLIHHKPVCKIENT
ncbi:MAG: OsmC family protein [Saprospiraceae bacterium]|nr:OsmC family protein [Saprospiraceae bacterium]